MPWATPGSSLPGPSTTTSSARTTDTASMATQAAFLHATRFISPPLPARPRLPGRPRPPPPPPPAPRPAPAPPPPTCTWRRITRRTAGRPGTAMTCACTWMPPLPNSTRCCRSGPPASFRASSRAATHRSFRSLPSAFSMHRSSPGRMFSSGTAMPFCCSTITLFRHRSRYDSARLLAKASRSASSR